ncbi:SDR family NAD(P)-dependent oxidoreductase [Pseudovibrio sp. Tun.PSC04-5.I4]|uniref:SDR family NAD(P)-dependent oxidoreductase n=1 Tax=Pseudovibrio sp. Tun.PSC04-5.I4 TaxID=1798213 RepID=UPI000890D252|nr:SDR family NAD(P)-dependent oxidoreductase [Pseudovibrio sp. Tun.PSC04-5.I4]SDQ15650.1 NAD(P)-dependent dehydrogenase, short-chain alcohol dehydrogenase family [Pseudovibrio sp. Tun.PSC04-5.I4]
MELTDFNMDFFSLKGKNAIVTGGNGGLGQAFCMALAKAGANILVPSLQDDDGTTQKLIESCGVEYKFMQADITAEGECKRVVDECVTTWGSVDILVNCAGISINEQDVTKYGRTQWDKMVAVNLTAAFEMIHESCKYMIKQESGKIINIASLFSFLGGQWSPAYAATKHGIVGLTKSMCDELAQWNIQVNAIAPGYYATPLTAETRKDEKRNAEILAHIPANRWGWTADLMGATVFLSSSASDYVNGTVLTVDGGYLMR